MSLHDADLAQRLNRLLTRKAIPSNLASNAQAQRDEMAALLDVLRRRCPARGDDLSAWWQRFEAHIGEHGSSFWPSEKLVYAAAKSASDAMPKARDATGWSLDPIDINAKRMAAGEPVGENWLFGADACSLIERGLIERETMDRYRKGAFMARREVYGHDKAVAWEGEQKARHAEAWRRRNDTDRQPRDVSTPDKRA